MNKTIRILLILILIVSLITVGVNLYWGYLLSAPNSTDTQTKRFIVYKGESACGIGGRLAEDGLVRSSRAFCLYAQISQNGDRIQEGDFKLSPSMDVKAILEQLKSGVVHKWVTLLEGWRVEEMADELSQTLRVNKDEFINKAKEGYMFPDTYLFGPDTTVEQIIKTMSDNFDKKYGQELKEKVKKQGLTEEEGMILASIVEREAKSEQDRKAVASILLKRYNIGMGLNADATIQYALGYQKTDKKWWKKNLTKEDLKIDSPYNTYLYSGLPPAPIANPSLSSLQAVAEATETPYLYYYHDSKGVSHFAKTLEEHNANIANYP